MADIPYDWACMLIKLKGRNIPRKKKKLPRHVRTNAFSLKGVIN
jgi:hypothetical protein